MAEKAIQQNLRRIEGQVQGLQRMIAEGRECDAVLMQIMAAQAALDRVASDLIQDHMQACFEQMEPAEVKAAMAKVLRLISKH